MPSLHAALLRALALCLVGTLAAVAPASARVGRVGPVSKGGWNRADQRAVERAGVLPSLGDGAFHGERPLAGDQLRQGLQVLAEDLAVPAVPAPTGPVSVAGFDRLLVRQLGLADVAAAVLTEVRRAGLAPPARFGTEVVARQLGLRFNHPAADDAAELYPWQPITRAEAAYSLARVLDFDGWEAGHARAVLARFRLPAYTAAQRAALRVAVTRIGMPYVWGGESDAPSSRLGRQARGGYDCSGLAWRVFKLSGLPAGRRIGGRTAAQQAGEIARSQRVRFSAIRPGDLLFFGPGRFWQKATERRIVHEGIALSADFMIHSSSQGVYVSPLFDEWRRAEFSWARRVL
jgi:cell wall-associated NlpC family hydrolase